MRKTKIVCTMGPATESDEVLEQLILGGMNVARLNFSHGDYKGHKNTMDRIKKLREKAGLPVAILLDTKGPEVRLRDFKNGSVDLARGQTFTLKAEEAEEFREVLYTMKPEEAKGWNRSLILRHINVPNQVKDELVMMMGE